MEKIHNFEIQILRNMFLHIQLLNFAWLTHIMFYKERRSNFWKKIRNRIVIFSTTGPWPGFWECGCQSTDLPNESVNWHPQSLKFIKFSQKSVGANLHIFKKWGCHGTHAPTPTRTLNKIKKLENLW